MSRGRTSIPLLLVVAGLTGCRDAPSTPLDPLAGPPVAALDVRLPAAALRAPIAHDTAHDPVLAKAPTAPAEVGQPTDLTIKPREQIFNARTEAGFKPGFAYAFGTHDYQGNLGRVVTTATASHRDRLLGSQTAETQEYFPFLVDGGFIKKVWTWAKIFTDYTCGVTVSGSSVHSAWWQFFQGRSAPIWGTATKTTQAAPVSQPGCGNTGGYESANDMGGGLICYYWITYDLDTGEVVDAKLIACSNSAGDKI